MNIVEACNMGLIQKVTACELLEAQAACGKLMDILSGKAVSMETAMSRGILERFEAIYVCFRFQLCQ